MKDYCIIEGLKRIETFDPNFELQDWCFERVIYEESITDYRFFNKSITHKNKKVPLDKICATFHIDYANKNWLQILGALKRFDSSYTKNSILEYINTRKEYPGLSFSKFGDSYSISEGNHRICQARFSQLEYLITDVVEYILDEKVILLYKEFKKLNLLSTACNFHHNDSEKPNEMLWILSINNKEIYLRGLEQVYAFWEFYDKTKISSKNLLKKEICSIFCNKNEDNYVSIRKPNDLYKLKNDIIDHKLNLISKTQ